MLNQESNRNFFRRDYPKGNFFIFMFFTILLIGCLLAIGYQKIKSLNSKISFSRPTDSQTLEKQAESLPVKLLKPSFEETEITVLEDISCYQCQPYFFDPKITRFYKEKDYYRIEGEEGALFMMIFKGPEKEIYLPSPFEVTIYEFECASRSDFVIEITKENKRHALYTHVEHFSFSPDGKKLYLVNCTDKKGKIGEDKMELHRRIIDIETKKGIELPNLSCLSVEEGLWQSKGFWQGDRLVTFSIKEKTSYDPLLPPGPTYPTDICIWDQTGKLLSRLSAQLAWFAGSVHWLDEQTGLLPKDADIFYAFTSQDKERASDCSLFLVNIFSGESKVINVVKNRDCPPDGYCYDCGKHGTGSPQIDVSELYFDHGYLRYRLQESRTKEKWSDWEVIYNK